ncbi:protein HGH1 homolog [Protopterus annectens]|uniref:protein HGH1 homolog n=1 Tax=Protopterus annectens TaxID=7888 RepID=UPI001CFB514D|nr:protein HGH1 homolog [Protopterus annectens]XP_043923637.1 protein HGH1 homolog [Protopterus annectens]XP_043923638.1 protein HGH1 homolog [Protopterus annectens]XP_043923639.1 protein HGH1 homolog [Protopterus annectens]
MLNDEEARELLGFLTLETRPDLKAQATEYLLGLTGTVEGRRYLLGRPDFLQAFVTLTSDRSIAIVKDCYHAIVNLSADAFLHETLVEGVCLLPLLLKRLLDPDCDFADQICSILSNLTREEKSCKKVLQAIQKEEDGGLARLVEAFYTEGYNKKATLHYLGPLLSNLTQLPEARQFLLDKDRCVVQRLLPYTQYEGSIIRRGGVVGTIKNCCFDYAYHEWLLGDSVDVLPFLLLPLAGPEEFTEEEMEGLPVDLQYLPEDKKREPDPDIRKMLIETIMLLTTTKAGRCIVKDKKTYLIMREFHKWEKEPDVITACEKLVQVLIGDEPEPGMENLMQVKIPEEMEQKFLHLDLAEETRIEKEQKELEKSQLSENTSGDSGDVREGLRR